MRKAGSVGRGIGKTIKWLLVLGALIIVIVVIAIIVSLGNASSDSDKSSQQVSPAEYTRIHQGDTIASVKSLIGAKPESQDDQTVSGTRLQCIYYGVLSTKDTYQFCFQNGRLFSKSKT